MGGRRTRPRWAWGLLTLTVFLAGCKFKHYDQDVGPFNLNPKDSVGLFTTDPQPKDMDFTVTATTNPPTSVVLYLVEFGDDKSQQGEDERVQENAMEDVSVGRDPKNLVAKSSPGEAPTLQATAPAGKKYVVIAGNPGGQKTELKAKILGKY